jgi:Cd2+/Zn2+-exporting ATPase
MFLPINFTLLLIAIAFDNYFTQIWLDQVNLVCSYISVASCFKAFESIRKRRSVLGILLLSITTIGAFAIREYQCCCNAFFAVGEVFPNLGCSKSKTNIKLL